jgi:transcriptional regulator with XRE-family HTH domain
MQRPANTAPASGPKVAPGQALRAARLRAGLSQAELAAKFERTPNWIGKIEQGRALPSGETALGLAELLDLPDLFSVAPCPCQPGCSVLTVDGRYARGHGPHMPDARRRGGLKNRGRARPDAVELIQHVHQRIRALHADKEWHARWHDARWGAKPVDSLSSAEVAAQLKVVERSVYEYVAKGLIRPLFERRIGGNRRQMFFDPTDVQALETELRRRWASGMAPADGLIALMPLARQLRWNGRLAGELAERKGTKLGPKLKTDKDAEIREALEAAERARKAGEPAESLRQMSYRLGVSRKRIARVERKMWATRKG